MTQGHSDDTAGAGSPAPAVPSPPAAPVACAAPADRAPVDVVPDEARVEVDRIRRRWAELPLDLATSRMPLLRRLLADLASRSAPEQRTAEVPDLGPAVAVDQLAVLVWDAYAAGRGDGIPELLTEARRALA